MAFGIFLILWTMSPEGRAKVLGGPWEWTQVPGQILVRLKAGASPSEREEVLRVLGNVRPTFHPDLYKILLPAGISIEEAMAKFKPLSHVAYAQPNYVYHAAVTPCDPGDLYFNPPYSTPNNYNWPFLKIHAPEGWGLFGGCPGTPPGSSSVTVAVLDTGISRNHPDLVGVPLVGFNAIHQANGSGPITDSAGVTATDDDFGHGTFVAGIIGASSSAAPTPEVCAGGSSSGMVGVAPGCTLLAVKVLNDPLLPDRGSGTSEELAAGTYFAAVTMGAKVINYSLASPVDDPTEKDAIDTALNLGCVVVAAAGNFVAGESPEVNFPAAYPGVLSVGSTDPNDQVSGFSCYGPELKLVAPGGVGDIGSFDPSNDIFSAMWQCPGIGAPVSIFGRAPDPNFGTAAGTSAASPFVAGAAALVLSLNPTLTNIQVAQAIVDNTDSLNGGKGWDAKTGYGRLNIYKALSNAANPLGAGQVTNYLKTFNSPNPFYVDVDNPTNITLAISQPAPVKLSIYDVSGELVYRKSFQASELNNNPGNPQFKSYYIPWDGHNGTGQKVKTGVYFYTVETPGKVGRNKIAVIRGAK